MKLKWVSSFLALCLVFLFILTGCGASSGLSSKNKAILSEAELKYKIAEAFYNGTMNITMAANIYYNTRVKDVNRLIATKNYYKEAYKLAHKYIADYTLEMKEDWCLSVMFHMGFGSDCIEFTDDFFAELDNMDVTSDDYPVNLSLVIVGIIHYLYSYLYSEDDIKNIIDNNIETDYFYLTLDNSWSTINNAKYWSMNGHLYKDIISYSQATEDAFEKLSKEYGYSSVRKK